MKQFALLSIVLALTACGGGNSDAPATPPSTPPPEVGLGTGGTPPGTGPVPGPGGTTPVACANSPSANPSTRYLGVLPSGQTTEFHVDTAARVARYMVAGQQGSLALVQDPNTCSYTASATGLLPTALSKGGLALSAVPLAGGVAPVMLVAEPERDVSAVAGTYNVLRYEQEQANRAVVRSAYATLSVNANGTWRLCPEAEFSIACRGPSGTLASNAAGGFDIMVGSSALGRLFAKRSATSKMFVAAIADNSEPAQPVHGMWIGASNEAFAPGTLDGPYVTSTTEGNSSVLTLAGLTAKPEQRPTPAALLANKPVQGAFSIVTGDPAHDVGLVTDSGLYADVAQAQGRDAAFMRFGVRRGN